MGFGDTTQYHHGGVQVEGNPFQYGSGNVRAGFVSKVLGILGIQLLVTFGGVMSTSVHFDQASRDSLQSKHEFWNNATDDQIRKESIELALKTTLFKPSMLYTSYFGSIILLFGAVCIFEEKLKKMPFNMIFLSIWTLLETHIMSFFALKYDPKVVSLAMGLTAVISFLMFALVKLSNFDFSSLLPIMIIILFVWLLVIIIGPFLGLTMSRTAYAGIGATIFTILLAVDIKMVVGGGKHEYDEEEYVFAVINIYLDLINLFAYFMMMIDGE